MPGGAPPPPGTGRRKCMLKFEDVLALKPGDQVICDGDPKIWEVTNLVIGDRLPVIVNLKDPANPENVTYFTSDQAGIVSRVKNAEKQAVVEVWEEDNPSDQPAPAEMPVEPSVAKKPRTRKPKKD
jgi:hypothetical protein